MVSGYVRRCRDAVSRTAFAGASCRAVASRVAPLRAVRLRRVCSHPVGPGSGLPPRRRVGGVLSSNRGTLALTGGSSATQGSMELGRSWTTAPGGRPPGELGSDQRRSVAALEETRSPPQRRSFALRPPGPRGTRPARQRSSVCARRAGPGHRDRLAEPRNPIGRDSLGWPATPGPSVAPWRCGTRPARRGPAPAGEPA